MGGVVGGVGGAIVLGALVFFFIRRARKQRQLAEMEEFQPHNEDDDEMHQEWSPSTAEHNGYSPGYMTEPFAQRSLSPPPPTPKHAI